MAGRGLGGDVAHGEKDDGGPAFQREDLGEFGGVEGAYPGASKAKVGNFHHEVSANYGGIDLGAVLAVHGTDPGIFRTARHNKDHGRVKGIARGLLHLFPQLRILHHPDVHGLPVHGRRRQPCGLQDALDVVF